MHRRLWFLYASWNTILLYLRASPRVRHVRREIHLRQDVDLHVWKWRRGSPRGRLCPDVVRVSHTNRKGIQILRQLHPRRMLQLRKGVPRLLLLDDLAPKSRGRKTPLPTLHQASSWHRLPRLRASSQDNWRIFGRLKTLIWVLCEPLCATQPLVWAHTIGCTAPVPYISPQLWSKAAREKEICKQLRLRILLNLMIPRSLMS